MHKCVSVSMVVVVALLILPFGSALAGGGNLSDCLAGCRPGDTMCTDCCVRQFPDQSQTPCDEDFGLCNEKCESLAGLKALMCYKQCQSEARKCLGQERHPEAVFNCPGWVRPEECLPCQTWSPRLQKCVGAPKELCIPQ